MDIEENENTDRPEVRELVDCNQHNQSVPVSSPSESQLYSPLSSGPPAMTTMSSWGIENPTCERSTLDMNIPFTDPPRQQIIVPHLPNTINIPRLPIVDPTQLKPIDLSVPVTSMTLDTQDTDKIQEMNTDRVMPAKARASITLSECRYRLRLARKQAIYKMGLCAWSVERRLLLAVRNADVTAAINLLQSGVDPNVADNKRRTPLHIAASMGLDTIVSHLLAARADPNRQDILGNTPLHLAVCRGDTRIVNILLRSGADITHRDNVGRTPVCIVKSRLGTLKKDKSISTDKLISECQMISDVLKVHCSRKPVIGTAKEEQMLGSNVDLLCNMLKNISTREQADEIADTMIEQMSQMCIVNPVPPKVDKQQTYYLSIL
uniref:Uncharacterized protein n=1 Tax=Arion vulgaris TaxID=1028688 RepID=A0A0B7AI27_9EUPU